MQPIVIINPNSTATVTAGMDEAVQPLRMVGGPAIECLTLEEGPPGIETEEHLDAVVQPLCALIRTRRADASAFIIGCYSDPGLTQARELVTAPVFGIAESAMLTAMMRGARFGVISILEASIPRHARYARQLGFDSRCAGDRAIGLGVAELGDADRTFTRMRDVGIQLRDQDGADVIIMGCAGMARQRDRLEEAVGVPVVEPTQAAAALALGAALLA